MPILSIPDFSSEFQPIYSLVHRRMIGVEALLRFKNSPLDPSSWLHDQHTQSISMDQYDLHISQCHLKTFKAMARNDLWLFLNIDTSSLEEPDFTDRLASLAEACGLECSGIVLEIGLAPAPRLMDQLIASFHRLRQKGFLLAVDNFGLNYSRIDKIFDIAPHFVKLDAQRIPMESPRLLQRLVHLLHELGAIVHLSRLEKQEQIEAALESGCDFVQGYWLDRPSVQPFSQEKILSQKIDDIWKNRQHHQLLERKLVRRQRELAQQAFMESALSLTQNISFERAAQPMLALPHVIRCFVLDEHGFQAGQLVINQQGIAKKPPGFFPLHHTHQANWSRRHYFQNAMEQPGMLHLSAPYLSIADACRCVTLSMGIEIQDSLHVLCADLFVAPAHLS
jgi:EAL domain-containing protein (putative c-di-GMP-specific phosphodiesterase class I)